MTSIYKINPINIIDNENIINLIETHKNHFFLDTHKEKYNILEKYIYDLAVFNLKDKNINDYYIECWFKNDIQDLNIYNYSHELHYDKDEKLFDTKNIMLNPFISTITYLNDHDYSTLITDVEYDDEINNNIKDKLNISIFNSNKYNHISFNPKKKHGAIDLINYKTPLNKRYLFMFNIWEKNIKINNENSTINNVQLYTIINDNNIFTKNDVLFNINEIDIKDIYIDNNIFNFKTIQDIISRKINIKYILKNIIKEFNFNKNENYIIKNSNDTNYIEIYDNIIDDNNINKIINYYKTEKPNILKTNPIINRQEEINDPIGKFIDNILKKLNDDTKYIEIWYHTNETNSGNNNLHVDCDDYLLKINNTLCLPNNSHIVYLDNHKYSPTHVINDNNLIFIPNRKGRLLRFDGKLFHGISLPIENQLIKNQLQQKFIKRHVLLFNTWSEKNISNTYIKFSNDILIMHDKWIKKNIKNNIINTIKNNINPNDNILWKKLNINNFNITNNTKKIKLYFARNKIEIIQENKVNSYLFKNKNIENRNVELLLSDEIISFFQNEIKNPYLFNFKIL